MGVGRRILVYGIVALVALFILSCITIYQHRDVMAQYFSTSLSSLGGVLLYIFIFGIGIAFLLKAILR